MCRVLKVDKSSYYHWIKAGSVVKKVDEKLNELIEIIFVQGRQTYGTRRIKEREACPWGTNCYRDMVSLFQEGL